MADDVISLKPLLKLDLPDDAVQQTVAEYCRIDLMNLDIALSRHASIYAYAVAAHEAAKVAETRLKWELEAEKSRAFTTLTDMDPKMAMGTADKKVLQARNVIDKQAELLAAQGKSARLRALTAGLEHRRDMLVQISARQRAEMAST